VLRLLFNQVWRDEELILATLRAPGSGLFFEKWKRDIVRLIEHNPGKFTKF
jgi:hypothetical protein